MSLTFLFAPVRHVKDHDVWPADERIPNPAGVLVV
jgi:hypothetical protein